MEELESEFYSKKDIHDCFIKYLIIVYKYDISDILSMSDDEARRRGMLVKEPAHSQLQRFHLRPANS